MFNMHRCTPSKEVQEILLREMQKKDGNYNQPEILKALKEEFHNKCYLCEQKNVKNINIEHFKPHRGDKELKFSWNNLYFACGHCNNIKSDKYDDILDPASTEDAVENLLHYKMPVLHKRAEVEIAACVTSRRIVNTANLLNAIYNGTTTMKEIEAINMKKDLVNNLLEFTTWLNEYDDDELDDEDRVRMRQKIKRELNVKSQFSAFKRQIIKDTNYLKEEFGKYIL